MLVKRCRVNHMSLTLNCSRKLVITVGLIVVLMLLATLSGLSPVGTGLPSIRGSSNDETN